MCYKVQNKFRLHLLKRINILDSTFFLESNREKCKLFMLSRAPKYRSLDTHPLTLGVIHPTSERPWKFTDVFFSTQDQENS